MREYVYYAQYMVKAGISYRGISGVLIPYRWSVGNAWPLRRQTYGYLPSHRASPLLDRYRIILHDGWGTKVWTTCPESLRIRVQPGSQTHNLSIASPTRCDTTTRHSICNWLKPNSITLASSELAPNMFGASSELVRSWFEAEIWPII